MVKVPKRVADRLIKHVGPFQRILQGARDRDINESDTVTIIADILGDVFGFDKYSDVTREHAIRGTFCDLAIRLEGNLKYLIEVKAIGLDLTENHLRQAVNYAANQGVQWAVLTNGIQWEIYRVRFERPIECELLYSFNFLDLNARKREDQARLFVLCKEGLSKDAIEDLHEHLRCVNRFVIGAVVQEDSILDVIRRELRRLTSGLKVDRDEIREILVSDVLKRDVVEGEEAKLAQKRVKKAARTALRRRQSKSDEVIEPPSTESTE